MTNEYIAPPATPDDDFGALHHEVMKQTWQRGVWIDCLVYDQEEARSSETRPVDGVLPDGRVSAQRFAERGYLGLNAENVRRWKRAIKMAAADGVLTRTKTGGDPVPLPEADVNVYWEAAGNNAELLMTPPPSDPQEAADWINGKPSKKKAEERPKPSVLAVRATRLERLVNKVHATHVDATVFATYPKTSRAEDELLESVAAESQQTTAVLLEVKDREPIVEATA